MTHLATAILVARLKNGPSFQRLAICPWNALSFAPVTTTALRIELTMQQGFSAGLQEWKVK